MGATAIGIDSGIGMSYRPVNLHRPAGQYNNLIPTRFLTPIDWSKIPALEGQCDDSVPTWFLASIDCSKIPAQTT
jgi:hypothetical protein